MPKNKLGHIRIKNPFSLRIYRRLFHKYHSHDINYELQLMARHESALYVKEHMSSAIMYENRWPLLETAISDASKDGYFLEFGVEKGSSANFIARHLNDKNIEKTVHAFDSFEGLPEEWSGTFERTGKFSLGGKLPDVLPNVRLHKGWFSDSIANFLNTEDSNTFISLLHIDCDLFSSTKDILDGIGHLIVPGTIVVFDEYFNYHNWQEHEFKAWNDFVQSRNIKYRYRGFVARGGQVYVQIL